MIPLPELIKLKYPDAIPLIHYCISEDYRNKEIFISRWDLPYPLPSDEDLNQWQEEFDLIYRIEVVRQQRKTAYPPIPDQLDMIYHDKVNNTNEWQELITEIKNEYPKPTE